MLTRDAVRSRRKHRTPAHSLGSAKRATKAELVRLKVLNADVDDYERPKTRGDCADTERPCPFVSCRHHLYLDVNVRNGNIKLNFPDLEVDQLPESCALDVAEYGGMILEEVAEVMNLTRERVRQIEIVAKRKWRQGMSDFVEEDEIRRVG